MAIINFTGFESGETLSNVAENNLSGVAAFDTGTVHTGTYSLKCAFTAGNGGYASIRGLIANGRNDGSQTIHLTTVYGQFYMRFDALPTSTNETEFYSISFGGQLRVKSDGKIRLYNSAQTLIATGTKVLATNTWYLIQCKINVANPGAYEILVDGVSDFSGTGNLNADGLGFSDNTAVGAVTQINATDSSNFYFDDVVVDDAAFTGVGAVVKAIIPTSNGTTMTWTNGTGASDYTQVLTIPVDAAGATYVMSPTTGNPNVALFNLQDCATVGITGTIVALKAFTQGRENTSVTSSGFVRISSNGSTSDSTAFNATTSQDSQSRILVLDPNTSAAWTTGGIDAVQIGKVESNAVAVRCSSAIGYVLYIPSAGGTNSDLLSFF